MIALMIVNYSLKKMSKLVGNDLQNCNVRRYEGAESASALLAEAGKLSYNRGDIRRGMEKDTNNLAKVRTVQSSPGKPL